MALRVPGSRIPGSTGLWLIRFQGSRSEPTRGTRNGNFEEDFDEQRYRHRRGPPARARRGPAAGATRIPRYLQVAGKLRLARLAAGTRDDDIRLGLGLGRRSTRRRDGSSTPTSTVAATSSTRQTQYTNGTSRAARGRVRSPGERERLVVATKYTVTTRPGDPNAGGNHRKSMVHSRRGEPAAAAHRLHRPALSPHLGRHARRSRRSCGRLDDLVRAGQGALRRNLRHARVAGLADAGDRRAARLVAAWWALQVEYSLIERTVERELIPMAGRWGSA